MYLIKNTKKNKGLYGTSIEPEVTKQFLNNRKFPQLAFALILQ